MRFPGSRSDSCLRAAVAFGALFATAGAQALPQADALKKLSVEELMNIEVTSVSRRPERLAQAPSAIQVISGEEIRIRHLELPGESPLLRLRRSQDERFFGR